MVRDPAARTIRDFGDQWTLYRDNEGYYGSSELLADIVGPCLDLGNLRNARVAEVGSGTGRIVRMLLDAGAGLVIAVEPSAAFDVLRANVGGDPRVTCLNVPGSQLPAYGDLDYVFCIGVLHHIPEPQAVVDACRAALRPGGRFVAWVYGREGNELYIALATALRTVTTRLPHALLAALVRILDVALVAYLALGRVVRLPLARYLPILRKLTPDKRRLVIYDQLQPWHAKYYTREEAAALVERRFEDVIVYHRRGYSWTLFGTRPSM